MKYNTILITGATGFLGSHLVRRLYKQVNIIILKRSFSDTRRIDDLLDKIAFYDIDRIQLNQIFKHHLIDGIIHVAACYGRKGENISEIIDSNLMFPLKLFEAGAIYGVNTFINTDTFYTKYYNLYSLSKKQLIEIIKYIPVSVNIINVKLEHVYGPDDNENKFIPHIIQKMLKNETLSLTEGEQKRDFIYVDDVVNAFLIILNKIRDNSIDFIEFEVGSGKPVSIKSVVNLIHQMIGSQSQINFGSIPYYKNEIMESFSNNSTLMELGWKPFMSLKSGMLKIIFDEKNRLKFY